MQAMLYRSRCRRLVWISALGACSMLACSVGCYKRVVKAEGFGADGVTVQQPNRSDTAIDRAIFGGEPKANSRRPGGYTNRD